MASCPSDTSKSVAWRHPTGARTGCSGAAAGTSPAGPASRRSASGATRRPGLATRVFAWPEFRQPATQQPAVSTEEACRQLLAKHAADSSKLWSSPTGPTAARTSTAREPGLDRPELHATWCRQRSHSKQITTSSAVDLQRTGQGRIAGNRLTYSRHNSYAALLSSLAVNRIVHS